MFKLEHTKTSETNRIYKESRVSVNNSCTKSGFIARASSWSPNKTGLRRRGWINVFLEAFMESVYDWVFSADFLWLNIEKLLRYSSFFFRLCTNLGWRKYKMKKVYTVESLELDGESEIVWVIERFE